jgi:hypothetical protein
MGIACLNDLGFVSTLNFVKSMLVLLKHKDCLQSWVYIYFNTIISSFLLD